MNKVLDLANLKNTKPEEIPGLALKFITSFGLAAVVLFLLTLLTLLGTLNQIDESIYHTQKKYFESIIVVDWVQWFPVILPGGYVLLVILFFNILFGTLMKIRRNWKTVGLYISHFGILLLIFSAFVTKHYSNEANMALFPNMEADEALFYHDWQLEILPVDESGKAEQALVIPTKDLKNVGWDGDSTTFTSKELPFDVVVEKYARNSRPVKAAASDDKVKAVDGFALDRLPLQKESETNAGGAYVRFVPKEGGDSQEAIIWAHQFGNLVPRNPYPVEFGGKKYGVQLVRERLEIPFTVRLNEFVFDKYAGVNTPRSYESHVTKIEDGSEEEIIIKMNEPLRHKGYTFFQASFGGDANGPPENLYTVLMVVKNPSDHWPLVSLIIVFIGLLIHMLQKLAKHLEKSSAKAIANASKEKSAGGKQAKKAQPTSN